jgi:hypothetical protein
MAGEARDLVFISYSREDRIWLDRLLIFLKPYTRQNLEVWADPYLEVGGKWRREISTALSRTSVGVLLASANFPASDFIYDEELPPLLEGADREAIFLVIIPISAGNYEATRLPEYGWVHPPGQPLDGLPEHQRNAVFVRIVKEIVTAAQKATPNYSTPRIKDSERAAVAPLEPVVPTGQRANLRGVPGQRLNHLRRQDYLDRLKQVVLGATDQAIGITGAKPKGGWHQHRPPRHGRHRQDGPRDRSRE